MEIFGTPALTEYSCKDLPSRTTRSCHSLRNDEIRLQTWLKTPQDLSLPRRPAYQTLKVIVPKIISDNQRAKVKSLEYIKCTVSQIKGHISQGDQIAYFLHIYTFFTDFTNHLKNSSRALVFSRWPLPKIAKYRDHKWDLPTVWKRRFLQTHTVEFT